MSSSDRGPDSFHGQFGTSPSGLDRPESACAYVYLLLNSNIFRYEMGVRSSSMILALDARNHEFDSYKRKKLFSMYVCIYY